MITAGGYLDYAIFKMKIGLFGRICDFRREAWGVLRFDQRIPETVLVFSMYDFHCIFFKDFFILVLFSSKRRFPHSALCTESLDHRGCELLC